MYTLYMIDANDADVFDYTDAGFQEVKDAAQSSYRADSLEAILRYLVRGLNDERYSDQWWYFVTDETNGIILMS